jgi:hypothetical protein
VPVSIAPSTTRTFRTPFVRRHGRDLARTGDGLGHDVRSVAAKRGGELIVPGQLGNLGRVLEGVGEPVMLPLERHRLLVGQAFGRRNSWARPALSWITAFPRSRSVS